MPSPSKLDLTGHAAEDEPASHAALHSLTHPSDLRGSCSSIHPGNKRGGGRRNDTIKSSSSSSSGGRTSTPVNNRTANTIKPIMPTMPPSFPPITTHPVTTGRTSMEIILLLPTIIILTGEYYPPSPPPSIYGTNVPPPPFYYFPS